MSSKFCLKRGAPSSSKKKVIIDSSTSEDETRSSIIARSRKRKSPDDFTASRAAGTQPSSVSTKTAPKESCAINLQSSSDDDDDSLLKPMITTNRRRITDSPNLLSQKTRNPPQNNFTADDSSADTEELRSILLKPTPKTVGPQFTPKSTGSSSQGEVLRNSYRSTNNQANDDSSEDTVELTKLLLGNKYSPPVVTTRNQEEHCDGRLPTEIHTAPPTVNHQESDSDNFELPDPEESSESSVASADSQNSDNWEDQKLPAREQPLQPCEQRGVPRNPYVGALSKGTPAVPMQQQFTFVKTRTYATGCQDNFSGVRNQTVTDHVLKEPFVSQTKSRPPDPSQFRLCDLREAALFEGSFADYDLSGSPSPSPNRTQYSPKCAPESSHRQFDTEQVDDQLERAAFFGDSPCVRQSEYSQPQTQVRMGLHSPRSTPFSQTPPARQTGPLRDDYIQDFSDEETAMQRIGRMASQALQQKRQSLLQTAQAQPYQNEVGLSNHHGPPRRFRDVSICDTTMSRSVVLRQSDRQPFGLAPRNELTGGSGTSFSGFVSAPKSRGRGAKTNKKGGWKGRGRWGKAKGKKQGGTRGRGKASSGDGNGFTNRRPPSAGGGFSRGDDANLGHVGGAEFSF
ncbi:hypothetical protein FisN_17Hh254 [Fistulifera solaris]|uniref:Uncharacterized protein n=1 Tax=Fistulifera solaris TaxID=1519565 RepID=A0A1Z5JH33_FISSO|nr:hypothetical protein FisN_17Hh254 [Fistulifera solaris]|eukprot:GAX13313.1 hypothetical protein FisN_17Hh254 [Fistulifera solaris]